VYENVGVAEELDPEVYSTARLRAHRTKAVYRALERSRGRRPSSGKRKFSPVRRISALALAYENESSFRSRLRESWCPCGRRRRNELRRYPHPPRSKAFLQARAIP